MTTLALLKEVREALFNLAPKFKERDCFGDKQKDCNCTACKLKRATADSTASDKGQG